MVEGRRGAVGHFRVHAPAGQQLLQDRAIRRVVVHDEHLQAIDDVGGQRRSNRLLLDAEPRDESKPAALPGLAGQPDPASHHLDQVRRDGQAQSSAPEPARRRRVGLHERAENLPLLLERDADAGIRNGEVQHRFFGRHAVGGHLDDDIAGFGELDRVAHEIDQHLPQAAWIADQAVGNVGLDAAGQLEALFVGAQGE